MPTINLSMRDFSSLMSLIILSMMVVEDFAHMLSMKGASEGLEELIQRLVLLAPCLGAMAAERAQAKVRGMCVKAA